MGDRLADLPGGRDDVEFVLLGAFDGDAMVGAARTDLSLLDNLHSAYSSIDVDPAHQRRGVGRALDGACVDAARANGRRLLMAEAFAPPARLGRAAVRARRWATSQASRTA